LSQAYPLATQAVVANAVAVPCRVTPGKTTLALAEAFQYGCPAPFADLGRVLGDATLWQLFSDFRLWQPPALPIPVTAAGESASVAAPELAAIGQGPLTVTPLHMALAAAALARHGEMPAPILITSEQDVAGAWRVLPPASHPIAALPPDAADTVKALMPDGYSALASSGAEGGVAAWFLGFAPFSDARYAVAVLLEAGDAGQAKIIGRRLLQSAIDLAP
jgi:peptidoglycan glycosyltransferase